MQVENHFKQTHPAQFETPTSGYVLLNAGFNCSWETNARKITFSIIANNLLNENYFDHLSRFKDYGIHNIGRNIVMHITIPFLIYSSKK